MNIVVLAGGLSTERDVSFVTGSQVTRALRENGHKVIMLDLFMGYGKTGDDLSDAFERTEEISVKPGVISDTAPDLEAVKAMRQDQSASEIGPNVLTICRMADVVFLGLHGKSGEDGRIQATLDLYGVRYTGSDYLSSAICMDKSTAKVFLKSAGVPTPQGIIIREQKTASEEIRRRMAFPCVIKPLSGGSSIGVSIVRSTKEMEKALEEAFRWDTAILVEEYIAGREFGVGVIAGKALPVIEIAPLEGFYDYKNKYKAGSTIETCPAKISLEQTERMQQYAELAAKALGLTTYARMDFLMKENGDIYCLEANTLPGMTPTSLIPQEAAAIGMNFNELCEKLIQISVA